MDKNRFFVWAAFCALLIPPPVLWAAGPAAVKKKEAQPTTAAEEMSAIPSRTPVTQAPHPSQRQKCIHGRHRCVDPDEAFITNHPRDMPTIFDEDSRSVRSNKKRPVK